MAGFIEIAHNAAAGWAKWLLEQEFIIVDTETSGLNNSAEIVQIGVLSKAGDSLIDTLLKPANPIPLEASRVHGITDARCQNAPDFGAIYDDLLAALTGVTVVAYNAAFDAKMIWREYHRRGALKLARVAPPAPNVWQCAMTKYAEFYGQWNQQFQSFTWQKLGVACQQQGIPVVDAHSALADCKMTLALIKRMAASVAN